MRRWERRGVGWNISSDPLLLKKLEACSIHNAVTSKSVKVTIKKISEFFYLKNTLLEKPQLNIINLRLIHPWSDRSCHGFRSVSDICSISVRDYVLKYLIKNPKKLIILIPIYNTKNISLGPRDPDIARKLRPGSLRARFGLNCVQNGVHCTDLPEDGPLEIQYFFKVLQ